MIASQSTTSPGAVMPQKIAVIVAWAPGVIAIRSRFGTMPRIDSQDRAAARSCSLPVADW